MTPKTTLSEEIEKIMLIHCNYGCDDPEYALKQMRTLIEKVGEKIIRSGHSDDFMNNIGIKAEQRQTLKSLVSGKESL